MMLSNLKKVAEFFFLVIGIFTFCTLMLIGGCTTMLLNSVSQYKGGDGHTSTSAMSGVSRSTGSGRGVASFGISCKNGHCQASQFGLFSNDKE